MIDVRQVWHREPRLADAAVAAGAAALTLLVLKAQSEGLSVYPQLSHGNGHLERVLPAWGLPATRNAFVALLACGALYWRRRRPVLLAVAMVVLSVGWPVAVPLLVMLFTVARHRGAGTAAATGGAALLPVLVRPLLPPAGSGDLTTIVSAAALVAGAVAWGLYAAGAHERALHAEREADLRAAQARQHAREEIAREMHDVLAHRLTLLSMHAGALEFHPTAPPERVAEAAGVIRESAGQALEDLQGVLRVLRAPVVSEHTPSSPQPTLRDTNRLIEEARAAGAEIDVRQSLDDLATMDTTTGRTAYRVLQEAFTNHRKHAPGTRVSLALSGGAEAGLSIVAANPVQSGHATRLQGSGEGLIGMHERVHLAGGHMSHRLTATGFHLDVWLPWTP
ncbi:sensor histidine kinase [Streptomyces sp. NPDC090106]|uniref:sensor histidine kinase n=1 Tax=Streptomyces sp. NPDC090106 TaxID=3365946 RepID=UPI00380D4AEE